MASKRASMGDAAAGTVRRVRAGYHGGGVRCRSYYKCMARHGRVGLLRYAAEHHGADLPAVHDYVSIARSSRHCHAGLDAVWSGRRREAALQVGIKGSRKNGSSPLRRLPSAESVQSFLC